jgi:transmembrane protein EpsG
VPETESLYGGDVLLRSEYVLILFWIGAMAIVPRFVKTDHMEWTGGRIEIRVNWLFAFLVFLPVIWMAGHRGNIGDTVVYAQTFAEMPEDLSGFLKYLDPLGKDWAFFALSAFIKAAVSSSRVVYFTIIAAVQGLILVSIYRKYSISYYTSVFLFLASADYISWMYNGIRQFMAVTIVFAGTGWMIERKHIRVILLILVASQFHASALLMIPIYLIAQGRAWNGRTLLFIVLIFAAVAFAERFTNIIDSLLADTQYGNVVADFRGFNDNGTSPIRALVYSTPTVFAFLGRKAIDGTNNPLINLCTNMSLITAGIYLLSVFTSGIFIGRLPIYASLYGYMLLPWEINYLYKDRSRFMIYGLMILFYLAFYFYQVHLSWGLF